MSADSEAKGGNQVAQVATLGAYARHRACSRQAVSKAIKNGLLETSVVRDAEGRPTIPDFAAADTEWDENLRQDTSSAGSREREARAELTAAKARMADLVYRQKAGELVNAKEVAAAYSDLCSTARNLILGIPNRLRQRHMDLPIDALATLDMLLRDALTELAGEATAQQEA